MPIRRFLSALWRYIRKMWVAIVIPAVFKVGDYLLGDAVAGEVKQKVKDWHVPDFVLKSLHLCVAYPVRASVIVACAVVSVAALLAVKSEKYSATREMAGFRAELHTKKIAKADPRPKMSIGWELSGKPAFGLPVTLKDVAFTNVGQESAHKVWIVPDKSQKYWIEQVAPIDMIKADGKPIFPALRAMHRLENGQEAVMNSSDDPIRLIAAVLLFDDLPPELQVPVEYFTFGNKKRHVTTYRIGFSSGHPSAECVSDE